MTIKCYKLVTGEDLIADAEDFGDVILFSNPAQILLQQSQDGRINAGLAPYLPFAVDGKVRVRQSAIAAEIEIDDNLQNEYRRVFGSGIVVANMLPK